MTRATTVSRRSLLAAGLAVPAASLVTAPAHAATDELRALERRYGAKLGVWAVNTRTGERVTHRAGDRIAFCSTFKAIAAAAVLRDHDCCAPLDKVIHYPARDVLRNSPITERHVDTGLTVGEIAVAAIQYSDATAGNLLLRQLGGPAGLTAFCGSIGDQTTGSDRWEPDLWTAIPGDPRDTTTPEALGRTYQRLVLGRALRGRDRDQLVAWLKGNASTASKERFRAGLPETWMIADKTGTGDYGVANDVGVAWTTQGTPLALCVMSTKDAQDAPVVNALVADAAAVLAKTLAPGE